MTENLNEEISQEQINEWKLKHGDIFSIKLGEKRYIYRPLKRFEYKTIISNQDANRAFNEEKIVQMCVLSPVIDPAKIATFKAGTISSLVELVMAASDFGISEEPVKL